MGGTSSLRACCGQALAMVLSLIILVVDLAPSVPHTVWFEIGLRNGDICCRRLFYCQDIH